jgi:hypothetical protein
MTALPRVSARRARIDRLGCLVVLGALALAGSCTRTNGKH